MAVDWGALLGGLVGAGGSLAGGAMSSSAAEDAASQQQDAAMLARQDQMALMKQQRQDAAPYRDAGYNALAQLNYLMGLGSPTATAKTFDYFDPAKYADWRISEMTDAVNKQYKNNPDKAARIIAKKTERIKTNLADAEDAWADYRTRAAENPNKMRGEFWKSREAGAPGQVGEGYGFLQQRFNNDLFQKDPGYQFRMDEGNKALQGSAAARGGLLSGAAAKAMQKYSQDYAANEYQNAYGRFTGDQANIYNRLAGISGTGQSQIQNTAQFQQQGLSNAAGYLQGAAQAGAAGTMGAANARASGYEGAANAMMDAWGAYQANKNPGTAPPQGVVQGEPNSGGYWRSGWFGGK